MVKAFTCATLCFPLPIFPYSTQTNSWYEVSHDNISQTQQIENLSKRPLKSLSNPGNHSDHFSDLGATWIFK